MKANNCFLTRVGLNSSIDCHELKPKPFEATLNIDSISKQGPFYQSYKSNMTSGFRHYQKRPVNLLLLLSHPNNSLSDMPPTPETFAIQLLNCSSNHYSDLDQQAIEFERQGCYSEAALKAYESLILKAKAIKQPGLVSAMQFTVPVRVLVNVVISWANTTIKSQDFLQAFDLLKLLSQLVKKRRKFRLPDRHSYYSQLCLFFAYFYLRDRKHNAALDCVAKGITAEEKIRSTEWRAHLHSMEGYASSLKGDHRKAVAFYLQAQRHLASTEAMWQAAVWYNLAVEHCNMHLRSDAVYYIEQAAAFAGQTQYTSQLHSKIVSQFRELTGAVPVGISQPPTLAFNFMPGGLALDKSSKFVEIRRESPKRNKSSGERKRLKSAKHLPNEEQYTRLKLPRAEAPYSEHPSSIRAVQSRDSMKVSVEENTTKPSGIESSNKRLSKKRLTTDLILRQDSSKRVNKLRDQVAQSKYYEVTNIEKPNEPDLPEKAIDLSINAKALEGVFLGYLARKAFTAFQTSEQNRLVVQSLCKGRLARINYALAVKRQAITGIQKAIRKRIALIEFNQKRKSVQTIEKAWKQRNAKSLLHNHRLAFVLQRAVRGKLVRLEFQRKQADPLISSAVYFKRLILKHAFERIRLVWSLHTAKEAFIRIADKYLQTRLTTDLRLLSDAKRKHLTLHSKFNQNLPQIIRIQKVLKGWHCRMQLLKKVKATRKLQGWTRRHLRRLK